MEAAAAADEVVLTAVWVDMGGRLAADRGDCGSCVGAPCVRGWSLELVLLLLLVVDELEGVLWPHPAAVGSDTGVGASDEGCCCCCC